MILRPLKIRDMETRLHYTYLTLSVCNSSALIARMWKTETACDAVSGSTRSYLSEPRPWANKIVAIAHNAKAFDLHFILNRAIVLK